MTLRTRVLKTGPGEVEAAVREAVTVLQRGGLVAFPTDTVYGLGAEAFSTEAVDRLYLAKGRSREKPIPVLLAGLNQMPMVAVGVPPQALRLADRFWPGPLTIVLQRHPGLPEAIGATGTVGVRVPDHPVALALLAAAGPLAVTSANRSGGPSRQTADQVLGDLEGLVDLILDGGPSPGGRPSTVIDCTSDSLVLLREGPISMEMITAALSGIGPA